MQKQVITFSPSANATTAAVEYVNAVGLYECFIRMTSEVFCRTSATSEAVAAAFMPGNCRPRNFGGIECRGIDIL